MILILERQIPANAFSAFGNIIIIILVEKLGGRVNVVDVETNHPGEIDLNPNGFHLLFGGESVSPHLPRTFLSRDLVIHFFFFRNLFHLIK